MPVQRWPTDDDDPALRLDEPKPEATLLCRSGHSFESRYTTLAPSNEQLEALDIPNWSEANQVIDAIEMASSKMYICDICTVCGLTVGMQNRSNND